jgi:HAMP domain-containing protein
MKNSLRFLSILMITLHLFLLLLLLWAAAVPLEQIQPYPPDNSVEIGNKDAFQENIAQIETLLSSAIVLTSAIGFVIPWTISRSVLHPILSVRNTIRQASRGDLEARVQVQTGKEFQALANELNRMMEYRKQEQMVLLRLNRTLSAISACRHEMIHEKDEKRLIQKFCRTLVDIGAYRMAWIGHTEGDSLNNMTLDALAGYQNWDLDAIPEPTGAETTSCPAARAIRNKHSAIISDVFADPLYAPLQAEATLYGYASIIALPLSVNRQIMGALTLCAEKSGMFGTEEVRLLTELADDLAYRIHAIRITE